MDYLVLFKPVLFVYVGQNLGHVGLESKPAKAQLAKNVVNLRGPRATHGKQQQWRLRLPRRREATALPATTSHLPPASRCASAPLSASVPRSCWSRAPSRPWPARTGWSGPGNNRWLVTALIFRRDSFLSIQLALRSSSRLIKIPSSCAGYTNLPNSVSATILSLQLSNNVFHDISLKSSLQTINNWKRWKWH